MISPFSPFTPALVLIVLLAAALPLFALGMAVQARLFPRLALPLSLFSLLSIATSALIGYAVFWCYFASAGFGRAVSLLLWLAALAVLLVPSQRRQLRRVVRQAEVAIPSLLMLCASFFYLTLHLGLLPDPVPQGWSWSRHASLSRMVRAPDNRIPLEFARRLYESNELRGSHHSDRPPLEAGLVLIQYPVWRAVESASANEWAVDAYYQVFGVLLQCTWISAAYALMRMLGLASPQVVFVLLALIPSHFFFIHSIFVWPKLLAGGLAVGTFCLLLLGGSASRPLSRRHMATAAALAALAVLAHGGVATSLVGFGLALSLPRLFPGWRNVLLGVLVMGALIAPWTAYQHYVDPPGNYVIKNHLAGIKTRDDRGTWEAVADAYSATTLRELAKTKWRKVRFVLGLDRKPRTIADVNEFFRAMRHYQFLHVFLSLDVLNAGWLAVAVGAIFGPADSLYRRLAYVLGIAVVCLIAWILLLLSAPIVQHGSYATMILLFTGLAAAIAQLPPLLSLPVLSLHVALSVAAILGFALERQYAPVSLAAAAASYLALVAFSASAYRRARVGTFASPPAGVERG
jgi:hypothetical protein